MIKVNNLTKLYRNGRGVRNLTNNAVRNILMIDPDILGLGGKGSTEKRITGLLNNSGFKGKIDYWGGDVGRDACDLLLQYGVGEKMTYDW
jgi:hypothetical protein